MSNMRFQKRKSGIVEVIPSLQMKILLHTNNDFCILMFHFMKSQQACEGCPLQSEWRHLEALSRFLRSI